MSEVLSRAQPYIQLEEVMKTFFNHAAKHGDEESLSLRMKPLLIPKIKTGGNLPSKDRLSILPPNPLRTYNLME